MVKNISKLCFGIFSLCVIIVLLFTESIYTYAEYTDLVRENIIDNGYKNKYGVAFSVEEDYYCLFVGEKQKLILKETEPGSWNSYKVPKTTEVSWSSMDKRIASVNKKGVVTAKKAGYTYIVATVEGAKVVCEITVVEPYLDYTSIGLGKGDSKQIKLIGSKAVSFKSSDTTVVGVSSSGVVSGKKYGTAIVTVTDNKNKKYKCKVNVTKDVLITRNDELTVVYENGGKETFDVSKEKVTIKEHANTVLFGLYPQSLVRDEELSKEITGAKYDKNGNAVIDGIVYKRITKWDTRYYAEKTWTQKEIEGTRKYNDRISEEGLISESDEVYWASHEFAYYRYEPIKWDILSIAGEKNTRALLVAHDVIEYRPYGGETWEKSSCRSFLNGEFLDMAFSANEKKIIMAVTNQNKAYALEEDEKTGKMLFVVQTAENDTKDRCYLLSYEDVYREQYGFCEDYTEEDYNRRCSASQYADDLGVITRGAIYSTVSGIPIYHLTKEHKESAWYALRSIYRDKWGRGNRNIFVNEKGTISGEDPSELQGIRPVINISVIFSGVNDKNNSGEQIGAEQRGRKNTLTVKYKDGTWQTFNLKTDVLKIDDDVEKVYFGRSFDTRVYLDEDKESDSVFFKDIWKEIDNDPVYGAHKYIADVNGKKYIKIEGSEIEWQNNQDDVWCCDNPIEWTPLKVENNGGQKRMLLMANKVVEGCYWIRGDKKWEDSKMREVLNNCFYEYAFTKQEKKLISTNEIVDSEGKKIRDKVFTFSIEDVTDPKYGFSSDFKDFDSVRRAGVNTYVQWSYSGLFDDGYCTEQGNIAHPWTLRPIEDAELYGLDENAGLYVNAEGKLGNYWWDDCGFLRPVIWIKVEG